MSTLGASVGFRDINRIKRDYKFTVELIAVNQDILNSNNESEIRAKLKKIRNSLPSITNPDANNIQFYAADPGQLFSIRGTIIPKPDFNWLLKATIDGTHGNSIKSYHGHSCLVITGFKTNNENISFFKMNKVIQSNNNNSNNNSNNSTIEKLGHIQVNFELYSQMRQIENRCNETKDSNSGSSNSSNNNNNLPQLPASKKFYNYAGLGVTEGPQVMIQSNTKSTYRYQGRSIGTLHSVNIRYDTFDNLLLRKIIKPDNIQHKYLFELFKKPLTIDKPPVTIANENNNSGVVKVEHNNIENGPCMNMSLQEIEAEIARREKELNKFKVKKEKVEAAQNSKKRKLVDHSTLNNNNDDDDVVEICGHALNKKEILIE